MPAVILPMYGLLKFNLRKAKREGLTVKESSSRTWSESLWYYFKEFDCKYLQT